MKKRSSFPNRKVNAMDIHNVQDARKYVLSWRKDCNSPKRRAWNFRYAAQSARQNAGLVWHKAPELSETYAKIAAYLEGEAAKEDVFLTTDA